MVCTQSVEYAMSEEFDVFISYAIADERWVQKLRDALISKKLRGWLDKDQIRPGDQFVAALEQGIASSKCVALVVSPSSMRSGWVEEEYHRALSLRAQVRLIPLLLQKAERPALYLVRVEAQPRPERRQRWLEIPVHRPQPVDQITEYEAHSS